MPKVNAVQLSTGGYGFSVIQDNRPVAHFEFESKPDADAAHQRGDSAVGSDIQSQGMILISKIRKKTQQRLFLSLARRVFFLPARTDDLPMLVLQRNRVISDCSERMSAPPSLGASSVINHPPHRGVCPVLHLHPMLRPASLIRAITALAHEPFKPHLARGAK